MTNTTPPSWPGKAVRRTASLPLAYARPSTSCLPLGNKDVDARHKAGHDAYRAMLTRAYLCISIIVCGLALRYFGFSVGLPAVVVKYGGSILWSAMVFFLVAMSASRLPRTNIALIATVIAVGVELFRLLHTPWLDAFRLTLPGALLLGRIFSMWNMLAYGAGIGLAMALDWISARRVGRAERNPP
jgi:hypothetical protein